MTASQPEPGWELQQQHPRTSPNDRRRRSSLQIESVLSTRSRAPDHGDLEPNTPKEHATWASNASSTTVGMMNSPSGTIPRWPFEEEADEAKGAHHHRPTTPSQDGKQAQHQHQHQHQRPGDLHGRRRPTMAPRPTHSRHVLRYWALEIVTVVVAMALLAAIIALLAHYDGHFMPEWPFQINLNSAIAFLTTFLRAAIVATVAEVVGQIKWTWFTERTRPLHHLQDFDGASRSVLGSLRLLVVVVWNWGFTSAGLLGMSAALVTVASLAVGPVTQQAVRTGTCPQLQPDARAAIPAAHFVPGTSSYYRVFAGAYDLEVDMKTAMIRGLTDPGGRDAGVDVACSSGNCTWPDYGTGVTHASIAMCSACLDTTAFVGAPDRGGNLTLPDDGAFINYAPGGARMWVGPSNLSAYAGRFDARFAAAASVSLANVSLLLASTAPCGPLDAATGRRACPHRISQSDAAYFDGLGDYVAAACVLYPCLREYAARVERNVLAERVVRTTPAVPNDAEAAAAGAGAAGAFAYANYTAARSPCVLDGGTWYTYANQSEAARVPGRTWANVSLDDDDGLGGGGGGGGGGGAPRNVSVPNACLYKMDGIFFSALSSFLSGTLFRARCSYDDAQAGHLDCGDAWWLTPLWGQMDATYASLDGAVAAFAGAVTNKLRATGAGPDLLLGQRPVAGAAAAPGRVYETTTCTYFDRRWVALPAALVLACAVLLAWIAVKNYRDPEQPVWKGSVLPLLFFGLHGPGGHPRSGGGGGGGDGGDRDRDRGERNATFFREGGRAAPELDRIQDEAGRTWVRFHGGADPGFVDLGAMGGRNRAGRGDPEASAEALVVDGGGGGGGGGGVVKRDTLWPEYQLKGLGKGGRRRRKSM